MRFRLACMLVALLWAVGGSALAGAPLPPKKVDVLIVGAGLSGLATAYELKKLGISYHILELTPRIGGRVRTVHYVRNGETLYADSGMEEYWESNPAVKILQELKLPLSTDVAASSMVLQGKIENFTDDTPTQYLERILTPAGLKKLQDFSSASVRPILAKIHPDGTVDGETLRLKDISFKDWVLKEGVPDRIAEWVRVSIECEAGTAWDQISALDGIAEFATFIPPGEKSVRVVGGNDRFTAALARVVGLQRISTNVRVNRITTADTATTGRVEVSYLDQATLVNGKVFAKHVVSTIPLFRLFEVQFVPSLSEAKQQAIATQNWGAYFKAHVFVSANAKKFWTKDGQSILPLVSDSDIGVVYDGNFDQKTKSKILSLLITGAVAEAYNLMPLDQVRSRIVAGLDKLWPGLGAEIQDIEFYRFHPKAIAAWPPGRSRFDALSEAIRKPENHMYLAGDFTESSHSDGAFISAARVAKQIRQAEKR